MLSNLHGSWKDKGSGKFPTIDSFEYEEQLDFEVNSTYPLIHYEQRTILLSTQEPSHWESGFIRVVDEDYIEISNSQDSGRVEVLRGKMLATSDSSYELNLVSISIENDPRLKSTQRLIKVTNDAIEYNKFMHTNTTKESKMLPHLSAFLNKV
jgi:hypothetical protein